MIPPVFLSVSIPDPKRNPKYFGTANLAAIREAVRALAIVVLPRTRLVFGGHPAITPLVLQIGQTFRSVENIKMYQSAYFERFFSLENREFSHVVVTDPVDNDRDASLELMRATMINSEDFGAAIFIGGMEGIEDEYALFRKLRPKAKVLPVASTGAAARLIFDEARQELAPEFAEAVLSTRIYGDLFKRFLDWHSE